MDSLHVRLAHPLRTFRLELELDVGRETFALVGPSGAGKTSVLRAIAGLLQPETGVIRVNGETWLDTTGGVALPPEERSVGLVFQDYALFPHLSVEANVGFGARSPATELLESFGIAHLAKARPGEISGGERQRVALARALARDPSVLLLDEPLSALDTQTRMHVRAEIGATLRELALPTIVVTHDFAEAATLADRIGVIVDGALVQTGTAAELISAPASPFVADFTGTNVLRGWAEPGPDGLTAVRLDDGSRLLSAEAGSGRVGAVVHPWDIAVGRAAPDDSTQNRIPGTIRSLTPVGNRVRVTLGPVTAEITAASAERLALRTGDPAVASFKATGVRLVELS
jgi:ABC-type sulfate/molybdate transport systems ATPase subunit